MDVKISIISLIISVISILISVPLGIAQLLQIKREKPKIKVKIDSMRSAFIEPLVTNVGNNSSLLITLTLINRSSSPVEITLMNIEFCGNTWDCLLDTQAVNLNHTFAFLDGSAVINTKDTGLGFPFRMEPYSSITGTVIFPYVSKEHKPIYLNVITPFATTKNIVIIDEPKFFIQ